MQTDHRASRASGPVPGLCPSAWAVIVLYSGLALFCALLAVPLVLRGGHVVLAGFLVGAGALVGIGAVGTYLRLTGRIGRRVT